MPGFRRRITFPSVIAVILAANGLLNLVTGLAVILRTELPFPLSRITEYVQLSDAQRISGVLSIFLGVVLFLLARGLYQRRRRSWGWALVLLGLLMANNLFRGTTPHTAALSGVLIAGLLVFRRRFDVRAEKRIVQAQVFALISILIALAYGIFGTFLMREEFSNVKTFTDAIYYTFVTFSTLGYGDMLPQTENAKLFAVSLVVVGLGSFLTAFAIVAGPTLEARMKGVLRIMGRFQNERGHVIVCGYSSVAESVVDELQQRHVPYIIIDARRELVLQLEQKGHSVITGEPTRNEVLEQANLKNAKAIVASHDSDSVNTLIALTASEYRKAHGGADFRIIVRVEDEGNVEKVRHVGADEVISPSTMGGRLMAQRAVDTEPRTS
jgi:voltage-gated potassium channel